MPALQRAVQLQQLQEGASLLAAPYLPIQSVTESRRHLGKQYNDL